jgi:hypothetical protein
MSRLTLQETMDRLLLLIRAGYPVIYIVSYEESRVLNFLAKIMRILRTESPHKSFLRWYSARGFDRLMNLSEYEGKETSIAWLQAEGLPAHPDWQASGNLRVQEALEAIQHHDYQRFPVIGNSLTVFFDLHPYLRQDSVESMVRPLRNAADALQRYYDANRGTPGLSYKTIVIVAPTAEHLSMELARDIVRLDFPLPETDELFDGLAQMLPTEEAEALNATTKAISADGILRFPGEIPSEELINVCREGEASSQEYKRRLCDQIAAAGRGLTLDDYRRGLNIIRVREGYLRGQHVEDMLHRKATAINSAALEYTPHVDIELGGLKTVREWIRKRQPAIVSETIRAHYGLPSPKGVLLCGVSGGGKSQLAKLIAREFGLALLRLDVGALFGMYVGESEERTHRALQLAELLSPVVLWLDEVDKAFTGMKSGGDNGISARVFGYFLTWLAEKQASVFVVATANDYDVLFDNYPEFGRKGRFDEIFWVGLPDAEARAFIFRIYLKRHRDEHRLMLDDEEITALSLQNARVAPEGSDPFERFCWVLGGVNLSGSMTGAEIEQAVHDAAYQARDERGGMTVQLVADCIKRACGRALYHPESTRGRALRVQEEDALNTRHWLNAG